MSTDDFDSLLIVKARSRNQRVRSSGTGQISTHAPKRTSRGSFSRSNVSIKDIVETPPSERRGVLRLSTPNSVKKLRLKDKRLKLNGPEDVPEDLLERCGEYGNRLFKENFVTFFNVLAFVDSGKYSGPSYKSVHRSVNADVLLRAQMTITQITKISTKIRLSTPLGGGAFGNVYKGKYRKQSKKKQYAVKKVVHSDQKYFMSNILEISFLMEMSSHPNIVSYYESFFDGKHLYMVLDFVSGVSLSEALKLFLNHDEMSYICENILQGLNHFHQSNFAHLDIKSSNIMISLDCEVIIVDLGQCTEIFEDTPMTGLRGTPAWISPEVMRGEPHTTKSDIFSLGVVLLEMLLQEPPLRQSSLNCMCVNVLGLTHEFYPSDISEEMVDFLNRCLDINPNTRSSAEELLSHPFLIRSVDFNTENLRKKLTLNNSISHFL